MILIFNLTVRTVLDIHYETSESACRKCERCTSLSDTKISYKYSIKFKDYDYHCEYFKTDVNRVLSEDSWIPCSRFKMLGLKKL